MNFCENLNSIDDINIKCNIPDGFESVGYIIKRKDIDFSAVDYGGNIDSPASIALGGKASLVYDSTAGTIVYNGAVKAITATGRTIFYDGANTIACYLDGTDLKVHKAAQTSAELLADYPDLVKISVAFPDAFAIVSADLTVDAYLPVYTAATTVLAPSTLVTKFALKSGAKAYKVNQLKKAFTDTETSLEVGDNRNTFTNTLAFKVFDQGPKVASIVNGLSSGEFVVILEQKDKSEEAFGIASGDSKYRIYGLENGLTASEITNNAYDDSIGNGWSVKMEETAGSSSAYYLFDTDEATTDLLIESLHD